MSIGKTAAEVKSENGVPPEGQPTRLRNGAESEAEILKVGRTIALPPKSREELKALLRTQNETQERVRLVLATLEEALCVPVGWVIRDVDEGFVEVRAE